MNDSKYRRWGWTWAYVVAIGCGGSSSGDDTTAATTDASSTSATMTTDATDSGGSSGPGGSTTAVATEGSSGAVDSSGGGTCTDEFPAIVTDIDETLTTSDEEFAMQLGDGTYDPMERADAAELIGGYADLGYRIVYLTARSETFMVAGTNETAREATERWLMEHGFPFGDENSLVILADNIVLGDAARAYKAEAIMDLQAEGWRFDYAYGNADTDVGAYADAMIDLAATFTIGEIAGFGGTVAIEGEGYTQHLADHLPTVPAVCDAAGG